MHETLNAHLVLLSRDPSDVHQNQMALLALRDYIDNYPEKAQLVCIQICLDKNLSGTKPFVEAAKELSAHEGPDGRESYDRLSVLHRMMAKGMIEPLDTVGSGYSYGGMHLSSGRSRAA